MTAPAASDQPLKEAIENLYWHHSIDFGNGIVSPGQKSAAVLNREAAYLPDVKGKSVLDIGAWDGWFSFEAERRGASRVVSLDHFMWGLDMEGVGKYMHECIKKGEPYGRLEETEYFHPDTLPGKRGYDLAHSLLGSRAEAVVCDYMEFEGKFDVCLYNGVLYHMMAPLLALQKVAALTREVAMIETAATYFAGFEHVPLCEFYDRDELLSGDPTNYWSPNIKGLVSMCRAAGFKSVDVKSWPTRSKDYLSIRQNEGVNCRCP